jgi:glutaconate CoA-transferase subunit B
MVTDPTPGADVTVAEVMCTAIAGRLAAVETAFQGFASPLPTVALRLAHERDGVTHLSASGAVNGRPDATPLSTEDQRLLAGATAQFTSPEAFDLAARGGVDVMFVGSPQFDRRGRMNGTVVGSWDDPKVKFGGGGGSGSLLPLVREAWAWRTEHTARSLPDEVDFVTAEGNLTYLVTPLCEFERVDGELQVASVHPGVSEATVRERTGWDVTFADDRRTSVDYRRTPRPTGEELALLDAVDPNRVRRSGFADLDPL